jgi:lysozyme family protein
MDGENSASSHGEIVVSGYPARYAAAVRKLLRIEGGFVDDPADHGGATKYGVSLRFLKAEGEIDLDADGIADFDLDMDGDIDGRDIRKLTIGDAIWIYHHFFWRRNDCDSFEKPIGEMLFDQAVNGGASAARKLLQRAINACGAHLSDFTRLTVDGAIGDRTRLAMITVLEHPALGMRALAEAYREAVRQRYRAIADRDPSQKRFLKGWLRRADELGRD